MSKVAFISDIHFGSGTSLGVTDPSTGFNTRFLDFISTFDRITEYLVENKIEYLFIAGDIYKNRQPTPTQQLALTQALNKLSTNKIHTYITLGNHDMVMGHGKAHTVSIFEELEIPYINVLSDPTMLTPENDGVPCYFFTFPYMNRQTCGVDDNRLILKQVKDQIEAWNDAIEYDGELRRVMVGHNILEGTSVGDIQPDINILNEPTFPKSFFADGSVDAAFFGHVHEHVVITKEPLVVSLGSMERIDFNDANRDKFLTVYDTETGELELEELTSRDFLNYKANLTGLTGDLTQLVCDKLKEKGVEGKIARVLIKIEKDKAPLIVKDRILEVLNDAYFSAGVGFTFVEPEDEDNIITDDLQPAVCVEEYLNRMNLDDDRKKRIQELSMAIMQEVDNDIEVVNT